MIDITSQTIEEICEIIGDSFTKSELKKFLHHARIPEQDDGSKKYENVAYVPGLRKSKWLFNCIVIEQRQTPNCFVAFLKTVYSPSTALNPDLKPKYGETLQKVNMQLALVGLEITKSGDIKTVIKATTADEVERRFNSIQRKLSQRGIHHEVTKYCTRELLHENYTHAVFEAAKGLAERVRIMTNTDKDGGELFDYVFSTKAPKLLINELKTQSDRSEMLGLKELMCAIFHLIRNEIAHIPAIDWQVNEHQALDILTMISVAHNYLDKSFPYPTYSNG